MPSLIEGVRLPQKNLNLRTKTETSMISSHYQLIIGIKSIDFCHLITPNCCNVTYLGPHFRRLRRIFVALLKLKSGFGRPKLHSKPDYFCYAAKKYPS